jgi:hypothetical protein
VITSRARSLRWPPAAVRVTRATRLVDAHAWSRHIAARASQSDRPLRQRLTSEPARRSSGPYGACLSRVDEFGTLRAQTFGPACLVPRRDAGDSPGPRSFSILSRLQAATAAPPGSIRPSLTVTNRIASGGQVHGTAPRAPCPLEAATAHGRPTPAGTSLTAHRPSHVNPRKHVRVRPSYRPRSRHPARLTRPPDRRSPDTINGSDGRRFFLPGPSRDPGPGSGSPPASIHGGGVRSRPVRPPHAAPAKGGGRMKPASRGLLSEQRLEPKGQLCPKAKSRCRCRVSWIERRGAYGRATT